ncbi:GNAT family N-acetyltransferase [Anaerotruncus sp. 80]|uniref:GNAT family N-acetyltransferase n=1 Tax=Anaerotruncus colihominis TaxID=169435 RepID=A0A845QI70_9FIRM|nr:MULTISPECIES: GNAT family N-acetyltransferase [Anaerotruncus]NBH61154.1 GNAT family N-acetyltransferase [Anaerotruncus colihominis]NCF01809.1 GNAT family N-acetyltransferase [Anaerotruncus sp. 80]
MEIKTICDNPQLLVEAASWFSDKWGVPLEAYMESMKAYIGNPVGIPKWFVILDEKESTIAGAGIIENDFHQRKDLTPNLCALFVEPPYRKQGLAKKLMNFAKKETSAAGFEKLYLITDHTKFYEKCGWTFYGIIKEDDGAEIRMYETKTGF